MLEQLAYSTIRLVKFDTMRRLLFDNQILPQKVRLLRSRLDIFVAFFYRYVILPGLVDFHCTVANGIVYNQQNFAQSHSKTSPSPSGEGRGEVIYNAEPSHQSPSSLSPMIFVVQEMGFPSRRL